MRLRSSLLLVSTATAIELPVIVASDTTPKASDQPTNEATAACSPFEVSFISSPNLQNVKQRNCSVIPLPTNMVCFTISSFKCHFEIKLNTEYALYSHKPTKITSSLIVKFKAHVSNLLTIGKPFVMMLKQPNKELIIQYCMLCRFLMWFWVNFDFPAEKLQLKEIWITSYRKFLFHMISLSEFSVSLVKWEAPLAAIRQIQRHAHMQLVLF